jgi:methionine sulfoxide reductase heme-binding subunit
MSSSIRRWKIAMFLICICPALELTFRALRGGLGANQIEFVTHPTGDWTLRFLLITLAVTPARRILGLPSLIRFRRMLGLFAFLYGDLHLITYIWFDKFFDFGEMWRDIGKRPFITVRVRKFRAADSTGGHLDCRMDQTSGGTSVATFTRLIYLAAAGGVIHYHWLVKSDVRLPVLYGGILTVLLAYRVLVFIAKRRLSLRHDFRAGVASS